MARQKYSKRGCAKGERDGRENAAGSDGSGEFGIAGVAECGFAGACGYFSTFGSVSVRFLNVPMQG
jgi:hypothetical protein